MIFSDHQKNVEKEICVCLNDEETRILFVDQKHGDMSVSQTSETQIKSCCFIAESTVFIFPSLQDLVCIDLRSATFDLCVCTFYLLSRTRNIIRKSQMSFP